MGEWEGEREGELLALLEWARVGPDCVGDTLPEREALEQREAVEDTLGEREVEGDAEGLGLVEGLRDPEALGVGLLAEARWEPLPVRVPLRVTVLHRETVLVTVELREMVVVMLRVRLMVPVPLRLVVALTLELPDQL